jgi:hypothetical protein
MSYSPAPHFGGTSSVVRSRTRLNEVHTHTSANDSAYVQKQVTAAFIECIRAYRSVSFLRVTTLVDSRLDQSIKQAQAIMALEGFTKSDLALAVDSAMVHGLLSVHEAMEFLLLNSRVVAERSALASADKSGTRDSSSSLQSEYNKSILREWALSLGDDVFRTLKL